MPTDMARRPTAAAEFVLRGIAASLGLFGLLRLSWVELHVVLPLTRVQGSVAVALFGAPSSPVEATLACSGTDALALCLGAILAYPVPWRTRLAGAGGGAALVLALNTVRIGTLGRVAASPSWFNALHIYVWPAILTIAIAGYVFAWMRLADRAPRASRRRDFPTAPLAESQRAPQPSWRFVAFTAVFLLVFAAASPLYLESPGVLALAGFIAGAAATILGGLGVAAHAAQNVLWTPRGGFLVTQECIATPLIPVYLAAICTYAPNWRRLSLGVLATVPLFTALGIARLLVVALPNAVMGSPEFVVHAFYQLLLGAVAVLLAALWRHGRRAAVGHALAGITVGVLFVFVLGPLYTRGVAYPAGASIADPQGAVAFLPAFQVGMYLALWVAAFTAVGWRRFLGGFALLALTQAAGLLALQAVAVAGSMAHVRDVRAWAVAGPVVIFAAVMHVGRARH